ncbi:MAG: hypothetical protein QXW80_06575 [Candidatus Micrarchaeia archaeon]
MSKEVTLDDYFDVKIKYIKKFGSKSLGYFQTEEPMEPYQQYVFMLYCLIHNKPIEEVSDDEFEKILIEAEKLV